MNQPIHLPDGDERLPTPVADGASDSDAQRTADFVYRDLLNRLVNTTIAPGAKISIDGTSQLRSTEGPKPTAGYPSRFRAKLTRVDDGHGHQTVVPPTVTLKATGYKTLTLQLPIAVPKML